MVSTAADQNAKHGCLKLPRWPHINSKFFTQLRIMSSTVNNFNASQFFAVEQHCLYLRLHSTEGRIING